MLRGFAETTIPTNGINLNAVVEGDGPVVILVHGWPDLWHAWRHQIRPIAGAGYRVVAIDVRGYGGSDKPNDVRAYRMREIAADLIGVIDHFGEKAATLVGHDWGAPICWSTTVLHPERVAAVAGLGVPYYQRGPMRYTDLWKRLYPGKFFYQLYFQEEGVAEAEFEADVRGALRKTYYSFGGAATPLKAWLDRPDDQGFLDGLIDPDPLPDWMSEEDLDVLARAFEKNGFRGPLNRYRNLDYDYDDIPEVGETTISHPSCFIAGTNDLVRHLIPGHDGYEAPGQKCSDLRISRLIDGKGHWIQQEAPDEVSETLIAFLRTV